MKDLDIILTMCFFFCLGFTAQPKVDNSVAGALKLDHSFERGIQFSKANYTLREDGKVQVLNSGIKNGKAKAKLTDNPAS